MYGVIDMGASLVWTGIVCLIFAFIARKLCNDDRKLVPIWAQIIVIALFFCGLISSFIGLIFQAWKL